MVSDPPTITRSFHRPRAATGAFPQRNRKITAGKDLEFSNLFERLAASKREKATRQRFLPMSSADIPVCSNTSLLSRSLRAIELFIGAFIVVGHNVFHIVPNEVVVLSVLGLISIRLRDGNWAAMGFKRPASWRRIFVIALVAAWARILLGQFVIEPITGFFWALPSAPELANEIAGNVKIALVALLLVWTFAAFGEEIAYRGYLLTRAADIGNRTTAAYWLGVVIVSILFGYGHYYKGASGIIDSGVAGLILGTAYMLAGRNIWASILAHGLIDTFGVIDAFFGWSK
jgi:membrane protease YdiL (CAAX protease family)